MHPTSVYGAAPSLVGAAEIIVYAQVAARARLSGLLVRADGTRSAGRLIPAALSPFPCNVAARNRPAVRPAAPAQPAVSESGSRTGGVGPGQDGAERLRARASERERVRSRPRPRRLRATTARLPVLVGLVHDGPGPLLIPVRSLARARVRSRGARAPPR